LLLLSPAEARTHVVRKGETVDQIAASYDITVKELLASNNVRDPSQLPPGTKLQVPAGKMPGSSTAAIPQPPVAHSKYAAKPKKPGFVTFVHGSETLAMQLVSKGKVKPGVLPKIQRIMRFPGLNLEHAIEPRLVKVLAQLSDHFGGRPIEVVSGFRPKVPHQHTQHSNHNIGHAMDLRVVGVPNEVVRDYCRTIPSTGVGYYPNSFFVHFDVRDRSTYWVDLSGPGETPRYVTNGSNREP
jgi:uncharacterized protein YcbK (DUF882 family)